MNIALINPEYPATTGIGHGGTATFTYALANALADEGHTVHVLVKRDTQCDPLHQSITVHYFDYYPPQGLDRFREWVYRDETCWERGFSRGARETIERIHHRQKLDIVEIPEYNGLAWAFKNFSRCPLSINFRTPRILIDRLNHRGLTPLLKRWYALEKKAVQQQRFFRSSSSALQEESAKLFSLKKEAINVIPNPVATTPFDSIARSPAKDDRIDILFAGRLERRKGAEIMLTILIDLLRCDPRIHLTFVGETFFEEATNYQEAMERLVNDEQRRRIWFLGPFTRRELVILYRRSDIFIFPSLFENSPNALLEAMAARLPITCADTPGCNEIIRHEQNGLLFAVYNPASLVESVHRYCTDPALAQKMSDCAYNDAKTIHHPQRIARLTIEYYTSLLQRFDGKKG